MLNSDNAYAYIRAYRTACAFRAALLGLLDAYELVASVDRTATDARRRRDTGDPTNDER